MKLLVWMTLVSVAWWYPPRLTITPEPGSTVSDVVEVRVTSNQPLKRVEFLLDGTLVGSDTTTPYTWTWDTLSVAEGEHVLTLRAIDWNDRMASTDVRYRVDNGLSRGGAYYLDQARQHLSSKQWDDALKAARRATRLLPNDGQAHHLLAQAWLGVSQWAKAQESAQQAVNLLPSPETYDTLAQAHLRVAFAQTTDEEKRFASLQSAVEAALRGGALRLSQAKTPSDKARALAQMGRLEDAATAYLQSDSTAQSLLSAARCYLLAGRWQDAERTCNLAERRAADKVVIGVFRVLALSLRGRTMEARNALEQMKGTGATETLLALTRANVALREMRAPEALRALLALREQEASSDTLEALLSAAFAEARDFPRAEDHFREALLRNPLNWQALAQKGYETLAVGSVATASRYFALAARIRPDDAWILCGQALCERDKRRGVELAQKAVRQSPADPWTLVALSYTQSRAGQIEEAFRTIERARNMDRQNYDIASPPDARRAGQIARIFGRRAMLPLE
ncbi:MAG: Ig-like domain-containing protein [Armatimonadota bacterium]|nr:Ig-like domain-containing protein [bacterium]MDW8321706.1 Ig-like domain-containing protein [Armatimonadota bacterium]